MGALTELQTALGVAAKSSAFPQFSAQENSDIIVGVDEAGRGPLAGPVVAAAVILCPGSVGGLADSKTLSEKQLLALEAKIVTKCQYGIGEASAEEIDEINILQATFLAMNRAVDALCAKAQINPTLVRVDGNRLPQWSYPSEATIKGDSIHPCISAASIVAKVHRDRMMRCAARKYPQYGWFKNKGYGTAEHIAAINEHGPSPLHRMTFAPVAQRILL